MKSNTRAMAIMETANSRVGFISSTVLNYDALQNVRDVFAAVRGGFEEFVNFLLLDQGDRVLFGVEQVGNRAADNTIGNVFEAVDLDAVLGHLLLIVQRLKTYFQCFRAVENQGAQLHHGGGYRVQPVS